DLLAGRGDVQEAPGLRAAEGEARRDLMPVGNLILNGELEIRERRTTHGHKADDPVGTTDARDGGVVDAAVRGKQLGHEGHVPLVPHLVQEVPAYPRPVVFCGHGLPLLARPLCSTSGGRRARSFCAIANAGADGMIVMKGHRARQLVPSNTMPLSRFSLPYRGPSVMTLMRGAPGSPANPGRIRP